ncbi:MAG: 50S ribosomal protein L4 [Candidatus Brocadiia bacterium]
MDIQIYDFEGKSAGTVPFDTAALGDKILPRLMHQAIVMYEANKRVGTAKVKTRSEVLFTKRKPWKQKHTGRARAGRFSSPLWVGGGRVFGPKPHDFSRGMPKKARRLALRSALLSKFQDSEVFALTAFDISEPRTKLVAGFLRNSGIPGPSILFVTKDVDPNVVKSVRNISKVSIMPVADLNCYDVLRHKTIIFTADALAQLGQEASK